MTRTSIFRGLAAAFACAAGTHAQAVMLDPRGLGQVLVFPYYTVNTGQDTLLSIVNASDVGKAVKVAFREGYNGRETLAFTLFLAPHDAWTGAVSAIDDGQASGARLASPDRSCVTTGWPAAFSTTAFAGNAADGGPTTADRTREGMLEVIALGDVVAGSATDVAITPPQTGQPDAGTPRCNLPANVAADLVAPTSGLFGSGAIANVGEGTFYAYAADALSGFTDEVLLAPSSRTGAAELADARSGASQFPNGAIATVFDANGEPLGIDYKRGIDAVSAVFMADALYNDFLVADGLGANTDWIITFPTKQFYVDSRLYPSRTLLPFEGLFEASGPSQGSAFTEFSAMDVFDPDGNPGWREDFRDCHPAPFESCPYPGGWFPYQVNTLAFLPPGLASSAVFGSRLAVGPIFDRFGYTTFDVLPISDSGWLKLSLYSSRSAAPHVLSDGIAPDGAYIMIRGLPVTGFMAYNIVNAQAAPNRLANYGGTFRHRSHWSCIGAQASCE